MLQRFHTFISLLLLLLFALPTQAVLKEDSLSSSLAILRQELQKYHDEYSSKQEEMKIAGQLVFKSLMQTMQSSNQNALMLYSQKDGYVFDLAYACHEATEQYKQFEKRLIPFRAYVEKNNDEVERFDSLITTLRSMPVMMLNDKGKTDRNVCLALAINTRRMVVESREQLREYISYYSTTKERLKNLNDYANTKYAEIQNNIFRNGGDNYFTILSRFGYFISQMRTSIGEKYIRYNNIRSQWDSRWILGLFIVILFYGMIAIILNQVIVRWIGTKIIRRDASESFREWFLAKRACIILASTAVTFAIILGIVKAFSTQNFITMASGLLVQFAWLMSVIIISIIIRVQAGKTVNTLFLYMPLLVNGFLVISFRVVLIPNALVNLIFPPILLICCIWQWFVLWKKIDVEKTDLYYANFSQIVFIVSLVCSMIGFTLLSVQILIWWIMQLTCILTITCLRDWYKEFTKRHQLKDKPITETWVHSFIYSVILPTSAVASVMISLYWATEVFNLSDMTLNMLTKDFVNISNFRASVLDIAIVITLWFIFNYINRTAKAVILQSLKQHDPDNAAQRFMMIRNILQIFIWGVWFLITLAVFNVSSTWLVVISGGLSTGIGFASKDILENIYYGISLMTGRIKIGDLIICDGVRGRVSSISYISTTIDTTDGSVIAFQNSQLFTKNYKNMTRNHGYECHILDIGVAYGTNIKQAKSVILSAISGLDCLDPTKEPKVVLKEFGDSALVLKVIVWVNVFTQYVDDGEVLEAIYDALNANNIEIPFPQIDVHNKV